MVIRVGKLNAGPHVLKELPRHHFNTRKTSNISRTLVGNKIVDNSDVVRAACRRCSNYIFILNLTPGFNGLTEDNC